MKIINKEKRLCLSCMEVHEVQIVEVQEKNTFKNEAVEFTAIYEYCTTTDEYTENEDLIKANDLSFKDAYRKKKSLLTSKEIIAIREKYSVSQKDFSEILGWGKATITRYENHQVQDEAHDEILRKLNSDPKWFIELLKKNKDSIPNKAYAKYLEKANTVYYSKRNDYLCESIYSMYAEYEGETHLTGGRSLDLIKVVEMINYLAGNVKSLHKVKLMKLLWYSDALSFKRRGNSISGLVYGALPMGAVPKGHEQIMMLEGISFDTVLYDDIAYKFKPTQGFEINNLSTEEIETMDVIVRELGNLSTEEIVRKMHEEDAYKCTDERCIISFEHANNLSIN
ncbi:MAG: DUF4065 domain-containing protein [Eubacteriales bacterium]|nr:DUF4065 domain-containing protein [Eubacteriales bacterium]MDD3350033.1 DUF4065 domain-containing protein [Eubacteriales bacterium]